MPDSAALKVDQKTGYVYVRLSGGEVAFTAELESGIVVDYDEAGAVRGIEAPSQRVLDKVGISKIVEMALKEKDRAPSGSESEGPQSKSSRQTRLG